eukprot:jgi/Galph1/2365/GphlegSOOS_G1083.1
MSHWHFIEMLSLNRTRRWSFLIKNETEKFLIPVAHNWIWKPKYSCYSNWILNSGVYYENGNGQFFANLYHLPSGFANEWLRIPSRCQLVVCLTTSLQSFLGPEAYSQLEHVFRNEDAIQSDSCSTKFCIDQLVTSSVER